MFPIYIKKKGCYKNNKFPLYFYYLCFFNAIIYALIIVVCILVIIVCVLSADLLVLVVIDSSKIIIHSIILDPSLQFSFVSCSKWNNDIFTVSIFYVVLFLLIKKIFILNSNSMTCFITPTPNSTISNIYFYSHTSLKLCLGCMCFYYIYLENVLFFNNLFENMHVIFANAQT